MSSVQISAFISESTKEALEAYADAHGLKKGFVIEEALLHHLQALRDLPDDIVVPARVVVSSRTLSKIAERVARPRRPTPAMRDLMK